MAAERRFNPIIRLTRRRSMYVPAKVADHRDRALHHQPNIIWEAARAGTAADVTHARVTKILPAAPRASDSAIAAARTPEIWMAARSQHTCPALPELTMSHDHREWARAQHLALTHP